MAGKGGGVGVGGAPSTQMGHWNTRTRGILIWEVRVPDCSWGNLGLGTPPFWASGSPSEQGEDLDNLNLSPGPFQASHPRPEQRVRSRSAFALLSCRLVVWC